jgi:hypothetical protein
LPAARIALDYRDMPVRAKYDPEALTQLFASQGGLARYAQLIALNVSPTTIRYRHRLNGPWQRALRGTYANHTRLLTSDDKVRAALLYGGAEALITGFAALQLRGIRAGAAEPRVQLLIPDHLHRTTHEFVTITRTYRMPASVLVRGTRCAPLERAAVDACQSTTDFNLVRAVVTELVGSRRTTVPRLSSELAASQVRHSARMRHALAEADLGIRSTAEGWCRDKLESVNAPSPVWNRGIVEQSTGRLVIPDALWSEQGVVLEVDSREHHFAEGEWEKTMARSRWLASALGLIVIHASPKQILDEWTSVWADLRRALGQRTDYRLPTGFAYWQPSN